MDSPRKNPNRFYTYIQRGTVILIEVNDILGEILMIKRVLLGQSEAYNTFKSEVLLEKLGKLPQKHPSPLIVRLEAIQERAERIRSMVTTSLDLRTTLEDALARSQQSTLIFIFTAISILFISITRPTGYITTSPPLLLASLTTIKL
ncbi:hypothetical protein QBC32DRAFT_104442 [Pseudoneurospora amorphoporcata]|uniref:Uncharacterized protein n=1 Tax=Pseudoneurospora amorphoporcata TaxID=241081 RepID=A0AAN6SAH6_9PEZI|nr:hypothetical protein QBC32DRAFT_104442 [Pseudoneurospora amorphoporcata]